MTLRPLIHRGTYPRLAMIAFAVVSALGACDSGSGPTSPHLDGGRRNELAPLPANAITFSVDSFVEFPYFPPIIRTSNSLVTIYSGSLVNGAIWGLSNPLGDGPVIRVNARVAGMEFSGKMSRVRLLANSDYYGSPVYFQCAADSGVTLVSESVRGLVEGGFGEWTWIEVAGRGIRSCLIHNLTGAYIAAITVVPQTQSKLSVRCDGKVGSDTVLRGGTMRCGISAPGSAITAAEWAFADASGRTIPGPKGDTTWGGRMVVGGIIRVRAQVGGASATDSLRIAIQPRAWPSMHALSPPHDSGAGNLPAQPTPLTPTSVQPFGYVLGTLGESWGQRDAAHMPFVGHADSISTGPNAGWYFVAAPLADPYFAVATSSAFDHAHPWYQKQHYGSPGGPANLPYCSKPDVDTLRMRTQLHEGLRQTPLTGYDLFQPSTNHYRFYRDWIASHDPNNKLYEALVWNADSLTARLASTPDQYMADVWLNQIEQPEHAANHAAVDAVLQNMVPITCRAR